MTQPMFCCAVIALATITEMYGTVLPLTNPTAPFAVRPTSVPPKKNMPFFDGKNGRITFGDKTVKVFPSGFIRMTSSGRTLSEVYVYANTPWSSYLDNRTTIRVPPVPGRNLGVESYMADESKKTITIRGPLLFHKKGEPELSGNYRIAVSLLPDAKVGIHFEYTVPREAAGGNMRMFWNVPDAKRYSVDAKDFEFPLDKSKFGQYCCPKKIRIMTENQAECFELSVMSPLTAQAYQKGTFAFGPHKNRKDPEKYVISMILDPLEWSGTASSSGRADLMKIDALEEETSPVRNLAGNPYFAQGRNHVSQTNQVYPWRATETVRISNDTPKFGTHCLEISSPCTPESSREGWILMSPISAAPGPYTISFYARGTKSGSICLDVRNHAYHLFKSKDFNVSQQWQRFSLTVHLPQTSCLSPRFAFCAPVGEKIFFDGLQIEKGDTPTEFIAPPVSAMLLTSAPDDFIEHGKKIQAKIRLSTLSDKVSGKASVHVCDMFDTVLYTKHFDFQLGRNDEPVFPLELEGKIPDGIHRVKVAFDVNGKKYNQFFRFSVMPFFSNTHKLKNMFSQVYRGGTFHTSTYPGLENNLKRNMLIGSGSDTHNPYPTPELDRLLAKYNTEWIDSSIGFRIAFNPQTANKKFWKGLSPQPGHTYYILSFSKDQFASWVSEGMLLADHRLSGGWTPEFAEKVSAAAAHIVRQSSPRRVYETGAEWPPEIKNDPHYVDYVMAVRKGVKSVYPEALFCEGGSYNMDIGSGVREIDSFLAKAKGKMPIELIHTHTYTHDILTLEPNFKALVDVVENKHGLKNVKYYFGEGMHYGPYEVPEWGLEYVNWNMSGWTGGALSNDIGWTEKIAAAKTMRSWLVFMTKFDQVLSVNASCQQINYALDLDLRPRVYQKIPNTLSALLGNVKRFISDVSFAPAVKCLVWEDELGRPVAAVWNQEPAADKGVRQGPWAKTAFKGKIEIFDMMGARRIPNADGSFPVSPFPFFLRGEPGSADTFTRAMAESVLTGDAGGVPFRVVPVLTSRDTMRLDFENAIARQVTGNVDVMGKMIPVSLSPLGKTSIPVNLPQVLPLDHIARLSIPYTFRSGSSRSDTALKFNGFAIRKFHGNWDGIPAIPITAKVRKGEIFSDKDFSAKFQAAWDADALHLRVTVTDDKFVHKLYPNPANRYNNDALQFFIDSRCSALQKGTKTFDEDDYAYSIFPSPDGKSARLHRWLSPDIQLTLGTAAPKDMTFADDVPCKFTRTADGYIYETAIPARYLLPARLEKNASMGFAMNLFDRDDPAVKDVTRGLTTTPEGTAPYNRPDLWPVMLLSE